MVTRFCEPPRTSADPPETYRLLRERQIDLTDRLRAAQERVALARRLAAGRAQFGNEVAEQRFRLLTIDLLPASDYVGPSATTSATTCPLCGSPLSNHDATIDDAPLDGEVHVFGVDRKGVMKTYPKIRSQAKEI